MFDRSVSCLVKCGADLSSEDAEGRTPVFLALLYACGPAARALLCYPQSLEQVTKVSFSYYIFKEKLIKDNRY